MNKAEDFSPTLNHSSLGIPITSSRQLSPSEQLWLSVLRVLLPWQLWLHGKKRGRATFLPVSLAYPATSWSIPVPATDQFSPATRYNQTVPGDLCSAATAQAPAASMPHPRKLPSHRVVEPARDSSGISRQRRNSRGAMTSARLSPRSQARPAPDCLRCCGPPSTDEHRPEQ